MPWRVGRGWAGRLVARVVLDNPACELTAYKGCVFIALSVRGDVVKGVTTDAGGSHSTDCEKTGGLLGSLLVDGVGRLVRLVSGAG
jgi:hypothetical protein